MMCCIFVHIVVNVCFFQPLNEFSKDPTCVFGLKVCIITYHVVSLSYLCFFSFFLFSVFCVLFLFVFALCH